MKWGHLCLVPLLSLSYSVHSHGALQKAAEDGLLPTGIALLMGTGSSIAPGPCPGKILPIHKFQIQLTSQC